MIPEDQIWDYIVCIVMLISLLLMGIYFNFAGGKQRSSAEYLMADKNMKIVPVAFSFFATTFSTIAALGYVAEIYLYGTQFVMFAFGYAVGCIIASYVMVPLYFDIDACSPYEYISRRYGKKMRSLISVVSLANLLTWTAIVLYGASLALYSATEISLWTALITLASICTIFCWLGGFKGVIWTDFYQSIFMFLPAVTVILKISLSKGFLYPFKVASQMDAIILFEFSFDLTKRYTFWNCFVCGFFVSLPSYGTGAIFIQRLLSLGTISRARRAMMFAIPMVILYLIVSAWVAITMLSQYHDCDPLLSHKVSKIDQLLPYAIMDLLSDIPGLRGLCFCGIIASCMTSMSSALNTMAMVTLEDIIKQFKEVNEKFSIIIAKLMVIVYGCLCVLLSVVVANFRGLLEASIIVNGSVRGLFTGVFCLGMFTTRSNQRGIIVGMLVGVCISTWIGWGINTNKTKIPTLPRSLDGCSNYTQMTSISVDEDMLVSIANSSAQNIEEILTDPKDVFPIYKISAFWTNPLACLVVSLAGYIASVLFGICGDTTSVDKTLISPVLRQWY